MQLGVDGRARSRPGGKERAPRLATDLRGFTRTVGLCQNIRVHQCGLSQSLKLKEQNKLRESTDYSDQCSPRKAEAVFIAASIFF